MYSGRGGTVAYALLRLRRATGLAGWLRRWLRRDLRCRLRRGRLCRRLLLDPLTLLWLLGFRLRQLDAEHARHILRGERLLAGGGLLADPRCGLLDQLE